MMAIMRKLINTKIYKVILWLFLAMMAIGSGIIFNVGTEKKWVIKAYGDLLTKARFDALLKAARNQKEMYRQKGIILAGKNIEKEAVVTAVSELLKEHAMSDLHVAVPESVVEQKMQEILTSLPPYFFHADGTLNEAVLAKQIAPQTIEDFLQSIRIEAADNVLNAIVDASSYTPDFELGLQYAIEFATKGYSVLKLSGQSFLTKAKESTPSTEVLDKFYKKSKNNEQFRTIEKRSGVFWKFNSNSYGISITESDIKKDYEKNKKDYLIAPSQMQVRVLSIVSDVAEPGAQEIAQEKIDGLYKQAQDNPESFVTLVKNFSEDKTTAKNGGLTKLFTQEDTELDKTIVKAAFESLITDGQISVPIKTDNGYAILQRVKKNPAQYKDLKLVANTIRESLLIAKFKQRFQQDANRVVSQARYNPELLQKFTEKGEKSAISLTGNKGGIEISQLFRTEEGRYAVFFDKNDGYVLLCNEIEKSRIPALDEVKDVVLAKYYEEEGLLLLDIALAKLLQAVRSQGDLEQIAHEYGTKLEKAYFEYKNETAEQSPILRGSAVQAKLKTLCHKGAITSVISDKDGLVIRLDSIDDANKDNFKGKEHFAQTMSYAKKYRLKEGFIASLYRRAKLDNKIEMKQEVLHLLKEA